MIGRDMDKAKKDTRNLLIAMVALLVWIIFLISLLPKNPLAREMYLSNTEILMGDILGLLLIGVLVIIGMVIGRWIEAYQYQKNGRYLGKGETA